MNQIGRSLSINNNNSFQSATETFNKQSFGDHKTFKSTNQQIIDQKSLNISLERALTKSNQFNSNNAQMSFNSSTKALSLWDSAYNTSSSHSNSKESLWTSAQSSPNSVQRDQIKHQMFSNQSNLWENPSSKLSQASLMSNSNNSIWCTPPRMHSPTGVVSNGWDNATTLITHKNDEHNDDIHSLVRPQDLSPIDRWNNGQKNLNNKIDTNETKWNKNSTFNRIGNGNGNCNGNVFTSTPLKPTIGKSSNECIGKNMFALNDRPDFYNNPNTTTPASSACMQLFSDDFMNYLNMINWINITQQRKDVTHTHTQQVGFCLNG